MFVTATLVSAYLVVTSIALPPSDDHLTTVIFRCWYHTLLGGFYTLRLSVAAKPLNCAARLLHRGPCRFGLTDSFSY
uniref:Secreted protein n=1 Tax=Parascaris univalens TaxID=6257 RepID=A0A915AWY9_PARUN